MADVRKFEDSRAGKLAILDAESRETLKHDLGLAVGHLVLARNLLQTLSDSDVLARLVDLCEAIAKDTLASIGEEYMILLGSAPEFRPPRR